MNKEISGLMFALMIILFSILMLVPKEVLISIDTGAYRDTFPYLKGIMTCSLLILGSFIVMKIRDKVEENINFPESQIMAEELFKALSELTTCDGYYSHIKISDGVDISGMFDLLTDGESYNKAVDVLKKYHLSIESKE